MRTRTLTGLTVALTTGGLASAAVGLHITHTLRPVLGGLALIAAAVPAATLASGQQATAITAEQAAAERAAGYRQGLMHAALGLLTPAPSTRVDGDDEKSDA